MTDQEQNIESLESAFPAASGSAFAEARKLVLESGQSVLQTDQGFIYRVFPDGRRETVKSITPPTKVEIGSKITIR